jgi:hypothetical protein
MFEGLQIFHATFGMNHHLAQLVFDPAIDVVFMRQPVHKRAETNALDVAGKDIATGLDSLVGQRRSFR